MLWGKDVPILHYLSTKTIPRNTTLSGQSSSCNELRNNEVKVKRLRYALTNDKAAISDLSCKEISLMPSLRVPLGGKQSGEHRSKLIPRKW